MGPRVREDDGESVASARRMGRAEGETHRSVRARCAMMGFAGALPILRVGLQVDRARDASRDIAANPDRIALLRHMNPAGAAKHRALGGDIARRRDAGAYQPLRETRIEAAGHRIFSSATHESADL